MTNGSIATIARLSKNGTYYTLKKPFPLKAYFTEKETEFVKRLARGVGSSHDRPGIQGIIRAPILTPDWEKRYEELRDEQRKIGIPDSDFWPENVRRQKGLTAYPLPTIGHSRRRRRRP